nr:hypothetical protein [Prevotella sp.]
MKKLFLVAAIFAASMGMANAATAASVNEVASVEEVNQVAASETYVGTASISKMNDNTMSGNYSATFDYDATNGDIEGDFSIVVIHELSLSGNVYEGATGTIKMLITGKVYDFTATFSNVVASGDCLSFFCHAVTKEGKVSEFTFTGTK